MQNEPHLSPSRIAITYAIGAATWIVVSDRVLGGSVHEVGWLVTLQQFKGLLFVLVTSILLYSTLQFERQRIARAEQDTAEERERVRLLSEHVQDLVYRYRLVEPRGFEYVSPSATTITGYSPQDHYDDPDLGLRLVVEEDQHLLADIAARAPGEPVVLRWRRKDGVVIWTEQRNFPVYDEHGHAVAIEGIARDVTRSERARTRLLEALRAEESARATAERSERHARRLQEVTLDLASATTRDAAIGIILDHAVRDPEVQASMLGMVDAGGEHLELVRASGEVLRPREEFDRIPLDAPQPPTLVVRTSTAVWYGSPEQAERELPGTAALMESFGSSAYACMPLVVGGRTIGALALSYHRPRDFDSLERSYLDTLARQCAIALERAGLREEIESSQQRLQALSQRLLAAQEAERRHIARELHDEFGQIVGALKISLHLASEKDRLATGPEGAQKELADSQQLVDELLRQVRTLSRELRPAMLDDLGLVATVEWLTGRMSERSDLTITVEDGMDSLRLGPGVQVTAFRIVQEALNNVSRHAKAKHVSIRFDLESEFLRLRVRDDGVGFDVARALRRATAGASLGLLSITERADLAGGRAEIRSAEGEGTEVLAWLPLEERPDGTGQDADDA